LHSVWLVKLVVNGRSQVFKFSCQQRSGEQGGSGKIINRVLMGNLLWKTGSCFFRFKLEVGNYRRKFQLCKNLLLYPVDLSSVKSCGDDSSQQGRCGVVRMPFYLSGKVYKIVSGKWISEHMVCSGKPGYNAGGRRSKSSCHRNVVGLNKLQTFKLSAAYG